MPTIPSDNWPDHTFALMREGNEFIQRQCTLFNSPVFETRLLFRKTICMKGREAAVLFYDENKFQRQGAAPKRLQKTLTGKEGVQGLDGENHLQRKSTFMALMSQNNIERLNDIFLKYWSEAAETWQLKDSVNLYQESNQVLLLAACEWCGINAEKINIHKKTAQMVAMIESPGSVGDTYLRGIYARKQSEKWAIHIIRQARQKMQVDSDSAVSMFATEKNAEGMLIDEKAAAVDLLNVIRPIVAIGRYIVFSALAIHENAERCSLLKRGEDSDYFQFVQEVRRYYPYFPFVSAIVKNNFTWRGYEFNEGKRVLLDLYGTNHDPDLWRDPDKFYPERFLPDHDDPFDLIPQGGGGYYKNHRCAGEWITITLMQSALKLLSRSMTYDVPDQNLHVDFSAMPTLPKSQFIISNVKKNSVQRVPEGMPV